MHLSASRRGLPHFACASSPNLLFLLNICINFLIDMQKYMYYPVMCIEIGALSQDSISITGPPKD